MSSFRIYTFFLNALRSYRDDLRGSLSVELVIVLPMLMWGYVAMMIFTDAYRARMEAQTASLAVADLISRQPDTLTISYLDGMNDVFDQLTTANRDTRLRISSIMWVPDSDTPTIAWSHGTRGLPSLLDLSLASMGGEDGDGPAPTGFDILENQVPIADLADRIPQVLPGEAIILVEAFTLWSSPLERWGGFDFLNSTRLTPIAVTRPRFSPFIRFEGDNDVYPEGLPETSPEVGDPPPPVDDSPDPDDPVDTSVVVVDTDFTDGDTSGWSSDQVTHTSNSSVGSFLGPFGQETRNNPVTRQINLGGASQTARIEFDLFIIDSWDGYNRSWSFPEGEHLMLLVNGTSIATEAFQHDPLGAMSAERRTVASRAEGRFTTRMTLMDSVANVWGSGWTDQVWRVVIDIENPAENFTLGLSANLDEPIHNESFGLMNFRVTAEPGDHGSAHFVPPAGSLLGIDSLTRFAAYSGCPDHNIPAQNLAVYNSSLSQTLIMRRNVGRSTWINGCGISGAFRYMNASPTIVLDYTNDTSDVHGNRLRIRADDYNNGRSCDSTILVRFPSGQMQFIDDLPGYGWNAGINLDNAPSGEYHIWLGNYGTNACHTDLILERY